MDINKNISIWRGNSPPPTQYHLWQKDNVLLHYNNAEWVENEVPVVSIDNNGLMSKEDKDRLDNLVYNNLDSDREDLALSAKLGKVLLDKISLITEESLNNIKEELKAELKEYIDNSRVNIIEDDDDNPITDLGFNAVITDDVPDVSNIFNS